MTPDELTEYFSDRLGAGVLDTTTANDQCIVTLDAESYVRAAEMCRTEAVLGFDMFDHSLGVDERDEGFAVITVLYSTRKRHRVHLRHVCAGGRDKPVAPSLATIYPGANWMERETYDMFGIEFDGHPGLLPRILCAENFEGWPLRKDFHLASREAKPWPGVKEPAELDEDGNVIERIPGPGEAVGPSILDEAMAKQAKLANPQPEALEAPAEATPEAATHTPAEASGSETAESAEAARARQAAERAAKAAERLNDDGDGSTS